MSDENCCLSKNQAKAFGYGFNFEFLTQITYIAYDEFFIRKQ